MARRRSTSTLALKRPAGLQPPHPSTKCLDAEGPFLSKPAHFVFCFNRKVESKWRIKSKPGAELSKESQRPRTINTLPGIAVLKAEIGGKPDVCLAPMLICQSFN